MSFIQKFEDFINTHSTPVENESYSDNQLLFLSQNSEVVEVFTHNNSRFFRKFTKPFNVFEHNRDIVFYKDYDKYLKAFQEMCWSENFADNFIEYGELCNNYGCNIVDMQHLTYFLNNGLDPQTGLEKLIKVALDGNRYVTEGYGLKYMIQIFLDHGANLPTSMIFTMPESIKYFEDDGNKKVDFPSTLELGHNAFIYFKTIEFN